MIYLGGPIDLISEGERHAWRDRFAEELLSRFQLSSYNPALAFKYAIQAGDKEAAIRLIEINKQALLNSSFAVFVMGKSTPSIGTPIELFIAAEAGIPHCVIWEPSPESFKGKAQLKVEPVLPAYVLGLADEVHTRFDQAIHQIEQHFYG